MSCFVFVFVFSSYWARVLAVDRDDSSSPEKIVPLGSGFFFVFLFVCSTSPPLATKLGVLTVPFVNDS